MMTSAQGRKMIEGFEGFRGTAYKPTPNDVWTIGYGHTKGVKEGDTCTVAKADAYMTEDLGDAEDDIIRLVKVPLVQHEFDALVSFDYNVGGPNMASSTLLKLLNAGDRAGAAEQFLRWIYQDGKVLGGLVDRRDMERKVFLTGYGGTS